MVPAVIPAAGAPRTERGAVRVLVFGVLLGSYVINAMDRQLFPLVAPDVRREYGFSRHRGAAVGAVNFSFALGAIVGPVLGGALLGAYGMWQVPMVVFGVFGFAAMLVIALAADASYTEPGGAATVDAIRDGGAAT